VIALITASTSAPARTALAAFSRGDPADGDDRQIDRGARGRKELEARALAASAFEPVWKTAPTPR